MIKKGPVHSPQSGQRSNQPLELCKACAHTLTSVRNIDGGLDPHEVLYGHRNMGMKTNRQVDQAQHQRADIGVHHHLRAVVMAVPAAPLRGARLNAGRQVKRASRVLVSMRPTASRIRRNAYDGPRSQTCLMGSDRKSDGCTPSESGTWSRMEPNSYPGAGGAKSRVERTRASNAPTSWVMIGRSSNTSVMRPECPRTKRHKAMQRRSRLP